MRQERVSLMAAAVLALSAVSCGRLDPGHARVAPEAPVGAAPIAHTPGMSGAELVTRLVAMAGAVHRPGDLTAGRVEAGLGVTLSRANADIGGTARGVLPSGIPYAFAVDSTAPNEDRTLRWSATQRSLTQCTFPAESLQKGLERAGYRQRPSVGAPLRGDAVFFDRDQATVMITSYVTPSDGGTGRCVAQFELKTWAKEG